MAAPEGLNYPLLQRRFGSSFERGQQYFRDGRVEVVASDGRRIEGLVRGTALAPYRAVVWVSGIPARMAIEGVCTCPLGASCKHLAALAIAWVESGRELPGLQPWQRGSEVPAVPVAPDPWLDAAPAPRDDGFPRRPPKSTRPSDYLCLAAAVERQLAIRIVRCRLLKSGLYGVPETVYVDDHTPMSDLRRLPAAVRQLVIATGDDRVADLDGYWSVVGAEHADAFADAVRGGVVRLAEPNGPVLRLGEPRPVTVAWEMDAHGTQRLVAHPASGSGIVVGDRWQWCLDAATATIAPTDAGSLAPRIDELARLPRLQPEHVPSARAALARRGLAPLVPAPLPVEARVRRVRELRANVTLGRGGFDSADDRLPHGVDATLVFSYDGVPVRPDDLAPTLRMRSADGVDIVARETGFETTAGRFLSREGFRSRGIIPSGVSTLRAHEWHRPGALRGPEIEAWLGGFVERARPFGVDVATGPDFPLFLGPVLDETELALDDAGNDWFAARLGVLVDGQPVDLLPILLAALQDPRASSHHGLRITLPDGRQALIPSARLKPILALIADLEQRDGAHGVPRERLPAVVPPPDWRFVPGARAREFLGELEKFTGVDAVEPPASLRASLRPYQAGGLAWLDFLRRFRFGGVLADDMGLGKTVQVLGHLAREREAGRLDRPALVVCPTSVAPNWLAEARRFVPDLRVSLLAAGDRTSELAELAQRDLVVTSYALMLRDVDVLAAQDWSLVVFDEAQWLKNRASRSYKAAVRLKAPMRLCLTGTPVENHLGELKAQFDLVMPGLLGDDRTFAQRFRGPIERGTDAEAATRLRQRLKPFLMRRTKVEVAQELPPRTNIQHAVELETDQRDLYETLRVQMEKRVRDALAERGLARSHITVLDALLKLRQVCCDPQLVDLPMARETKGSAKRDALLDLLPTLVEDGRSVLLFSQFTKMLDLVETDLREREIPFVRLDGSTRDRATPVLRFQAGEVPLFLISLKAGGVGLNLTRADTVILYDPWWNPAVEAQAIDRAHRIGQDKPVFVYELLCSGTVEEKMQALKTKKRAIADAVLASGETALESLGADELLALFAHE